MFASRKKYDVVGLGRSYVDIVCQAPQGFAKSLKIPEDGGFHVSPEDLKKIQNNVLLKNAELMPGGAVANTLAGLSALGGTVGFFGKFLKEEMGDFFGRDLRSRGIDLLCEPSVGIEHNFLTPAVCLILEEPDNKTHMVYNPGCADYFRAADFSKFDFADASYFVIESHSLRNSPLQSDVIKAIQTAKSKGCKIVFTLHDTQSWLMHRDLAREVVAPMADLILGTREEMKGFKEVVPIPQREDQLVVTTKDVYGSFSHLNEKITEMPTQEVLSIGNSVGAGDQYLAGLLMGLVRGMPLEKCMELATQCAISIIKERSARPKIRSRPKRDLKYLLGLKSKELTPEF